MKENKYPDRIPLDLKEYHGERDGFSVEGFTFTQEESRYFPNLIDLGNLIIDVDVLPAGHLFTVTVSAEGEIHLKDVHDGALRTYALDDSVEVIISPENDEENDIVPDEDGIYDLRGSVLALLFDAIPKNYSEVPLKRIEKDNYVIMSEEEYNASRASSTSSPFDALDGLVEDEEDIK